jgi:serine/threonine protein kinase
VVYAGENIHTNELVCVKVIDCMHLGAEGKETLQREIRYLQRLDSPRIVRLLDGYESPSFCYLVMEFCRGGDLFRFVLKSQPLHPLFARQIVLQIAEGLALLRQEKLIHRDLKTENVFLTEHFEAKIGDLGFCVAAEEQEILHNVGSPIYMSPEVLAGQPHSYASDLYGLAIIWYELLHRVAPWEAKSEEQLLQLKQTQPVVFLREDIPQKDRQMIERCLAVDPRERCCIEEVLAYCQSVNSEEMKMMMQREVDKEQQLEERGDKGESGDRESGEKREEVAQTEAMISE